MNSSHPPRSVDQVRVILGLLRETIFLQTKFELTLDSYHESITAELVEVNEATRRDEEETRTLVFRTKSVAGNFKESLASVSTEMRFKFGIDSFLVTGKVQLINSVTSSKDVLLYSDVPLVIEIENARKSRRKKSAAQLAIATVLVRSGNSHTEGVLELTDFSRGGYGGTLRVPNGFELVNDTFVQGVLQVGSEQNAISCRLKRAQLVLERGGDSDSYSVGLQSEALDSQNSQSEEASSSLTDRRRSSRLAVQEQVNLTAALNKDFTFRLLVDEASVTGFSGKLANPAHLVEFPIGSSFQMESPPLSVTLQGFEGDRLRFSIQGGTVNDRLEWFKRVSPYLLQGVSHSVFDARDLLEVFCSSGALSTEYLKTQKSHRSGFLAPFESSNRDHFWVHRWVHHNDKREVTGHWCALRLGDNGWFLTDLAGSPEKEKKIPKNFTELFFKSFAEFSLSHSPCPVHMYAWVIGHPYWTDFCEKVRESGLIRELVLIGYTRYSVDLLKNGDGKVFQQRNIRANEYQKIWHLNDKFKINKCAHHASLFDFDVDRFGSPILSDHFKAKGQGFTRQYIEFAGSCSRWLAVFSTFPLGASFNRVPESVWVFPVDGGDRDLRKEWSSLVPELFSTALSLGMKPSSIRRIALPGSVESYPGELAMMENLVVHPSASNLYEGKK